MARVTVEDCVDKVRDRFELVAIAAQRTKHIASGAPITIERNGEKNTVISLREIAKSTVSIPELREALIQSLQKQHEIEEPVREPEVTEAAALTMMEATAASMVAQKDAEEEGGGEEEPTDLSFAKDNLEVED